MIDLEDLKFRLFKNITIAERALHTLDELLQDFEEIARLLEEKYQI